VHCAIICNGGIGSYLMYTVLKWMFLGSLGIFRFTKTKWVIGFDENCR